MAVIMAVTRLEDWEHNKCKTKGLFYFVEHLLFPNLIFKDDFLAKHVVNIAYGFTIMIIYISIVHSYERLNRAMADTDNKLKTLKAQSISIQSVIAKYESQSYINRMAPKIQLQPAKHPPSKIVIKNYNN